MNIFKRLFEFKKHDPISLEGHAFLVQREAIWQRQQLEMAALNRESIIQRTFYGSVWCAGPQLRLGVSEDEFNQWLQGLINAGIEVCHSPNKDSFIFKKPK